MIDALEAVDVTKVYNQGKLSEVFPVIDVSLKIQGGSMVVLKGPSGSGKTTLLAMLGCHVKPNRGEVILNGKKVSKLPEKFMNAHKRDHIGFIFQQFQLIPDLCVMDNIMLPLLPMGIGRSRQIRLAEKQLEFLDLLHRKQFKVRNLSGGEQQRVAIARALVNHPNIILADEPTAHLDSRLTDFFLKRMKQLKESGHTIVMASHDPLVYDNPDIDQVVEMKDGRIVS
ncbi:MAG: ABC transporter ATP-binding protein [SAR324 cluster bacterium]|nr:ABC transporter ATP-binding protein [SAR324 cluster bacterium]